MRFLMANCAPITMKVDSATEEEIRGTPEEDDAIVLYTRFVVGWQYGRKESPMKGKPRKRKEE